MHHARCKDSPSNAQIEQTRGLLDRDKRHLLAFTLCGLLLAFFSSLLMSSCARIPPTYGKSRDIVVVSTKIDTQLVTSTLQLYNYVPQRESLFTFLFAEDTAINSVKKFHTLFLYGSLQDEFLNILLDDEAEQATIKDTFTLFRLEDLWSKHQLVVILAVSTPEYIEEGIQRFKDVVTEILEENYYSRVKLNYYTKHIDNRLKESLRSYGVTFDIAKGWLIDSTYKDDNFIFVHAHFPDRVIFFYKEAFDKDLTEDFVYSKRDSLTSRYYKGDYILREMTHIETIEFKGMQGMRLKGVWQNDSLVAGGPFLSYFFVDKDTLYVLDGMLFNPGERKTDYFTMMEVILNSFEIVGK